MKSKKIGFYSSRSAKHFEAGIALNVTKNKATELTLSLDRDPSEWFRVCTQWTRKVNYAGFCLSITLFWLKTEFTFFDKRQWNYKNDRFEDTGPDSVEFKYF